MQKYSLCWAFLNWLGLSSTCNWIGPVIDSSTQKWFQNCSSWIVNIDVKLRSCCRILLCCCFWLKTVWLSGSFLQEIAVIDTIFLLHSPTKHLNCTLVIFLSSWTTIEDPNVHRDCHMNLVWKQLLLDLCASEICHKYTLHYLGEHGTFSLV